ncbi:MAG: hypothetical protein KKB20_00500 [Proteobacteria bacterium]|nr:hypothetical protein [Pseudomonadota bacterium]
MKIGRIARIVIGLAAALAVLAGVMEMRAREELARARQARDGSETDLALKHYSRALNWYVPGGAAETAAEDLLELGLARDRAGRAREATLALMRMRSGLYGARSFYLPRRDLIERAEPVLARLRAREKLGPEATEADTARQARVYLDLMRAPGRPAFWPALAASAGFLIWVVSALGFIFRFFGRENRVAWPWAAVWAAGFVLWLWGMKWA